MTNARDELRAAPCLRLDRIGLGVKTWSQNGKRLFHAPSVATSKPSTLST